MIDLDALVAELSRKGFPAVIASRDPIPAVMIGSATIRFFEHGAVIGGWLPAKASKVIDEFRRKQSKGA